MASPKPSKTKKAKKSSTVVRKPSDGPVVAAGADATESAAAGYTTEPSAAQTATTADVFGASGIGIAFHTESQYL